MSHDEHMHHACSQKVSLRASQDAKCSSVASLCFDVVVERCGALWLVTIVETAEWTNVAVAVGVPPVLLALSSRC